MVEQLQGTWSGTDGRAVGRREEMIDWCIRCVADGQRNLGNSFLLQPKSDGFFQ